MDSFNDVKVGDMVIVKTQNREKVVTTVTRVTAKQFETKSPQLKFWKKNGDQVGRSTWYSSWVMKGSKEELQKVYEAQVIRRKASTARAMARDARYHEMDMDTLDAVINILDKFIPKETRG